MIFIFFHYRTVLEFISFDCTCHHISGKKVWGIFSIIFDNTLSWLSQKIFFLILGKSVAFVQTPNALVTNIMLTQTETSFLLPHLLLVNISCVWYLCCKLLWNLGKLGSQCGSILVNDYVEICTHFINHAPRIERPTLTIFNLIYWGN